MNNLFGFIHFLDLTSSQANYLFYTQTDADYYNLPNKNSLSDSVSQQIKINSILDALENIGYYGFVTFRATVQRIGLIKWSSSSCATQTKTQTQTIYSSSFKLEIFKIEK